MLLLVVLLLHDGSAGGRRLGVRMLRMVSVSEMVRRWRLRWVLVLLVLLLLLLLLMLVVVGLLRLRVVIHS